MSTIQDEQLLNALTALKNGDFSARLPTDQDGTAKEIAETFNTMMEQLNNMSINVLRLMKELAPEGRFGGQTWVDGLSGTWKEMQDQMDMTAGLLTGQIRDFAHAINALANGEIYVPTVPAEGETAGIKEDIKRIVMRKGSVQEIV
jgi:methyl-accepting chemotaxis protein